MKQIIKTLTAAALMIAAIGTMMTGCGNKREFKVYVPDSYKKNLKQEDKKNGYNPAENNPLVPSVLSEEEDIALRQYNGIVHALNSYDNGQIRLECFDKNKDISVLEGQEALKYCYEMLPKLECVDKWIGTSNCYYGWDDPTLNWNRQELMEGISIVEDVLVKQQTVYKDAVGKETGKQNTYYQYDKDGKLLLSHTDDYYRHNILTFGWSVENQLVGLPFVYEYDTNGVVEKIKLLSNNYKDVYYLITPEYDENGNKTCDTVVEINGDTWKYVYTYDDDNRLLYVNSENEKGSDCNWIWTFKYDEYGNVIKIEKTNQYHMDEVTEYVYEDGYVYGSSSNVSTCFETYHVTMDEQGRIVKWSKQLKTGCYDFILTYGECYSYSPVNKYI